MNAPKGSHSEAIARIRVPIPPAAPAGYDALVGRGLLPRLPELLPAHCPAHRYAIITDSNVGPRYATGLGESLRAEGIAADSFTFPAGESSKTRETWTRISDEMLATGFGRDCAVVAIGGGVVGDLGGFVAATFMRGVPFVQVPTSLLAMIDAAIGGKTGVDTVAGKNLVGAMHQPKMVVADPDALGTLPPEHLRAGMAEAVKHGAIADRDYFNWIEDAAERLLSGDGAALGELIRRSIEIKAGVVARDERESGPRKALNFGHTIGHAIEMLSDFRLLHGEAIAIGMVAEARLGEQVGVSLDGIADRLERLLSRMGLPVRIPGEFRPNQVLGATRSDKKSRSGQVEYALLSDLGSAVWGQAVADEAVERVINSLSRSASP